MLIGDRKPAPARILMQNGKALVPKSQLPKPRFPRELTDIERRVEKLFSSQGTVSDTVSRDRDRPRGRERMAPTVRTLRNRRGLFTRYLPKDCPKNEPRS